MAYIAIGSTEFGDGFTLHGLHGIFWDSASTVEGLPGAARLMVSPNWVLDLLSGFAALAFFSDSDPLVYNFFFH